MEPRHTGYVGDRRQGNTGHREHVGHKGYTGYSAEAKSAGRDAPQGWENSENLQGAENLQGGNRVAGNRVWVENRVGGGAGAGAGGARAGGEGDAEIASAGEGGGRGQGYGGIEKDAPPVPGPQYWAPAVGAGEDSEVWLEWGHAVVPRRRVKRVPFSERLGPLWAHQTGLNILTPYLQRWARAMGRRAMCRWRAYVLYMRGLLRRCFDGWNIDACHRRLQRMNAFRMLQLLCPLGKRLALRWLAQQWRRLQAACARVLIRRHVKLLFTCWKTVTSAMREGRRRVQGRAVQRLKQHVVEEGERERAMGRAFETILTRLRQQRAWKQWANRRRRSGVLRGVLLRLSRDLLRLALRHWRRPPCRARPARLAPAVPDGYVRRGSRLPPVPPHQVVALGALQSVRLAEQQLGARIEFRLRRVGGMQGHYERQQELRQEREEQLRGQQQRAAAAGEVLRGSHGHGYWQGQGPGAGQVGQSLNINTSHTHSSKYSPRHSRSDSPSYQATGAAGAGGKAAETGRGAAMTAAGTAGTAGTETVAGMGVVSRRGRYEEADLSTSDISSRGMGARAAGGAREDMGMGLGMMGMNPLASPPPNASLDASSIAFSVALSSEWPISAHIACTDSYADDFEEEAGSGSGAEAEA